MDVTLRLLGSTFLAMSLFSVQTFAADAERVAKMKNTIDELSTRVAELKTENQRLESALRDALSANRSGQRIVSGCDIEDAKKGFLYETNSILKGQRLMSWMKINASQCNIAQLKQLRAYADAIPLGRGDSITTLIDDLLLN
jgi:hypothetical protein